MWTVWGWSTTRHIVVRVVIKMLCENKELKVMAYKRKRISRNTRRVRRKTMPLRVPRRVGRSNNCHMFRRVAELTPITLDLNDNTLYPLYFKLDQLPNVSEFTNLYDQYRINKVKVTLVPNWTQLDAAGIPYPSVGLSYHPTAFLGNPNIHSVLDFDNSGMSGYTVNTMMQYSNYRRTRGNQEHSRYFTPAIQMGSQVLPNNADGGVATVTKYKPWLDFATDVPHYGMKILVDPGFGIGGVPGGDVNNLNAFIRVYVTFYFECKNVR